MMCDNLDNYKNMMIVYFKTKTKGKKQNGKNDNRRVEKSTL